MTMHPRIMSLCALLLALLTLLCAMPAASADPSGGETAEEALRQTLAYAAYNDAIVTTAVITGTCLINAPIEITGGKIVIQGGSIVASESFASGNYDSMIIISGANTSVTVEGTTITAHADADEQYGVIGVSSGKLTLEDSTISGGYLAAGNGAGIRVSGTGQFSMTGGSIENNTANMGGGLSLESEVVHTMSGVTIKNNTALARAGGVFVGSAAQLTMTGGTVENNSVSPGQTGYEASKAIYVDSDSNSRNTNLTISGNAKTDVTLSADDSFGATLLVTPGAVLDGEVRVIRVETNYSETDRRPIITVQSNLDDGAGTIKNGIYVDADRTFVINGGSLSGLTFTSSLINCRLDNTGIIEGDVSAGEHTTIKNSGNGSIYGTVSGGRIDADSRNTVTPEAGAGGSITPNVATEIKSGENTTFTIAPNAHYEIVDVEVDSVSQGAITSYTFENLFRNSSIKATFAAIEHTITASAGAGGAISPSGDVAVAEGTNQTFTITADSGYEIADVLVNGTSVGAAASYEFVNVSGDQTIEASFAAVQTYYPDWDADPLPEPEAAKTEPFAVICRTLNVRSGPGTSYAKLGTLARGAALEGTLENGWLRIEYQGGIAYVSAAYVQPLESAELAVLCRTLNVRAGAGTSYAKLGKLSRGTAVQPLETLGNWHKIAYGGNVGWVCADYIG